MRRHLRLSYVTLLVALALPACNADTGGGTVEVGFRIDIASSPAFDNALGWHVNLERACLAAGPIYVHGAPMEATASRRAPLWHKLYDAVVPSASAHVGEGDGEHGEVKAEWVAQRRFDLVGESRVELGTTRGTRGRIATVTLVLESPRDGYAAGDACLLGHNAYVVGVATRDTERVRFEGGLDLPVGTEQRHVDAIPLEGELAGGSDVVLRMDASRWLADVDFAELPPEHAGGRRPIAPGTHAYDAWTARVREPASYEATLE